MSLGALLNGRLGYKTLSDGIRLLLLFGRSCRWNGNVLKHTLTSDKYASLIYWLMEAFDSEYDVSLFSAVWLLLCCFPRIPTVCLP